MTFLSPEALQKVAEDFALAKRECQTAKTLADQAARRLDECAKRQGELAAMLGERVGSNVTRRLFQTKEGMVLVEYHNPTWTAVELVQVEPV